MTVYVSNANVIELIGLTSKATGVLASATVAVTIRDAAGVIQTGAGWPAFPLTMAAVATRPGDYRATFDDTVPWVAGKSYEALITAENGDGQWKYSFRPKARLESVL